jgi:hypothetical protein
MGEPFQKTDAAAFIHAAAVPPQQSCRFKHGKVAALRSRSVQLCDCLRAISRRAGAFPKIIFNNGLLSTIGRFWQLRGAELQRKYA